jgi:hypothetical protein
VASFLRNPELVLEHFTRGDIGARNAPPCRAGW